MKNKNLFINFYLAILISMLFGCKDEEASKFVYTSREAIKIAEEFVSKEGFTDIDPNAFCISEDSTKWDVGFLYKSVKTEEMDSIELQTDLPGRAVVISKDGSGVSIAHKDPLFSKFKKLVK